MTTQDYRLWKPAEELPTNTRPVLLAVQRKTGKPFVVRARYVPRFSEEQVGDDSDEIGEYCDEDDTYYAKEGWYECISFWDEWSSVAINAVALAWSELPEYKMPQ